MRVADVEWDRENTHHFREHGRCRWEEVEDVLRARCHPTRAVAIEREKGDEPRRLFYAGEPARTSISRWSRRRGPTM